MTLLVLAGCAALEDSSATASQPIAQPDAPLLQATAENEAAEHGWPGSASGVVVFGREQLFVFGDSVDAEAALARASANFDGVLLNEDGTCIGVLRNFAEVLPSEEELAGTTLSQWLRDIGRATEPCAAPALSPSDLDFEAANLSLEAKEFNADMSASSEGDGEPVPPPACAVGCGADDGFTYGGAIAYSNGSSTGGSGACGGTGTYGYLYQCVEYVERAHTHSDWHGNAYPGFWTQTGLSSTSTSQGPYWKSLLPLGSGTVYAAPQAGDIVVWSGGSYGHVALASSVGSTSITVYDQNRSCGDQSCTLTYTGASPYTLGNGSSSGYCGAEGISSYTVMGYLHRGWDFKSTYGLTTSSALSATNHNWWPNDASYTGGTNSGSVSDITDYITINPGTSDPYLTSPSGLKLVAYSSSATYGYRYFKVYISSNCSNKAAQFFWKRTTDAGFDASRSVNATISGSGWQTLTFDPSADTDWSGTIDQVRIDPATSCSSASTDTISIESAYFSK